MITFGEVKQIVCKLSLENLSVSTDAVIDDISCIVYRNSVFEYGSITINHRHIDIEFLFGESYEIHETSSLFQFIIYSVIFHCYKRNRNLLSKAV